MASLPDPLPALVSARVFPGDAVWTRGMTIDFRHEGRSDPGVKPVVRVRQERTVPGELSRRQGEAAVFEQGFHDTRDRLCARVHNRVAIRTAGYRPGGGALGSPRRG